MRLTLRHVLDRLFTGSGLLAIGLMSLALVVLLVPMIVRGSGAFVFQGTIEFRRLVLEKLDRGDREQVEAEIGAARTAREPVYRMLADFERNLDAGAYPETARLRKALKEFKKDLQTLLGPAPGAAAPKLMRNQYGQTRWDRAQVKLKRVLYREDWDYSNTSKAGIKRLQPRASDFAGTALEPVFGYLESHLLQMLRPKWTFYGRFLTDVSFDSHFFGGIGPEVLGTFYLAIGAMLLAIPIGLISAIYLTEYAGDNPFLSLLRSCISTLAGVPSIVFGLFGLAFFINTIRVSPSKSVLAGSMTLALMILPTIIRTSEEAIRSVPHTYREAALSLGAGRWHTIWTIILPAALPGILTGIVISMGRAAGETAPIIFTAAVSVGRPLTLWQTLTHPTPALSWNLYNLTTEHEAVDEIRHVQYGLALVLVSLVLLLNLAAIVLRARVARRLKI